MPEHDAEALLGRSTAEAPSSVLLAARDPVWNQVLAKRWPGAKICHLRPGEPLDDAERQAPFALALVVDPNPLDASWEALLAALRDRLAQRTLVLVGSTNVETGRQMTALGFRLGGRSGAVRAYIFDLFDYKDRPEWLSPAHWANPELWDRHRW